MHFWNTFLTTRSTKIRELDIVQQWCLQTNQLDRLSVCQILPLGKLFAWVFSIVSTARLSGANTKLSSQEDNYGGKTGFFTHLG